MEQAKVIESIKQVARDVLPKGSILYLYGSRARGDHHEDSDWDLLLLLDKPKLEKEDFDNYSYPFVEKGWDIGEDIRPHAYTKKEWFDGPHAMFYFNVEEDKKVLYEFK
jgi:predicted nucleotidyltransferase